MQRAVENMRGGGEALAGLTGAFGLEGVDRFAAAYPTWPEAFGEDLPSALKGLRVFIVKAGTGGAMFRSLHADFLRDMAELLDDADLRALAGTYDALASAWEMLATRAEGADHAGGAQAVEQIRSLEHLGVSLMQAWIEKHG